MKDFIIGFLCFMLIVLLSLIVALSIDNDNQNEELIIAQIKIVDLQAQLEKNKGYMHISTESGFLNKRSMMASFQAFGFDGEYWFKIQRPEFKVPNEFSVPTYTEAVMVLKGLY